MIELECDRCEESLTVDDDKAGQRVECPHCGDVNRVPESAGPESMGLPPEHAPEETIRIVRPTMFRAHPFGFLLLSIVLIGGLIGAGVLLMQDRAWLAMLSAVPAAVAAVWFIVWWIKTHWWVRLTITNKRTIRQEGIIRRHTSEVLHDHVRNIEIRQNVINRLTHVGYIGISSAGQDDVEIEVKNFPDPYQVKKIIDQYRKM